MPSMLVVTHERLGIWARHLRPRLFAAGPVRWVESRSGDDLDRAVRGSAAPVVVIDVADRPRAMLGDLDRAVRASPEGLFLVLDPEDHPGLTALAGELGATLVLSGIVSPPRAAELLLRWLPLARRRAEADGWAPSADPVAEPWERRESPGFAHAPASAIDVDRP